MVVNQGFGTLAAPLEGLRAMGENSHHQPSQLNKFFLLLLKMDLCECKSIYVSKCISCNIPNN